MMLALVFLLFAVVPRTGMAAVPAPTLEGPIAGDPLIVSTTFDLADVGYVRAEYFFSGAAAAHTSATPLASDGKWSVARSAVTAAYKSRIVVHRPENPRKFSGTVIVEWLNVTAGADAAVEWVNAHVQMIRDGHAWVGVSAQYVGIEGGFVLPPLPGQSLKTVDPTRYGSLVHPGDTFSYDIFSQAAWAIRRPAATDPLGGLAVKAMIATGESQSTWRLVTYVNGVQPVEGLFDGFLLHGRIAGAGALSEAPQPVIPAPTPALIRDDLDAPVLLVQAEGDLGSLIAYGAARQSDGDTLRVWEVAGTAHVDAYTLGVGMSDQGRDPAVAGIALTETPLPGITCPRPINSGPQHFVLHAALAALNRWVRREVPPPHAPRIETEPGPPLAIVRDHHGNALGGIRTPQLDVPIATFTGDGQSGHLICLLSGTTTPFDVATLASLYPTHRAYVKAFSKATRRVLRAGFILRPDAKLMKAHAEESMVGG